VPLAIVLGDGERCVTPARAAAKETTLATDGQDRIVRNVQVLCLYLAKAIEKHITVCFPGKKFT